MHLPAILDRGHDLGFDLRRRPEGADDVATCCQVWVR
jgi:hypothetical protein